MKCTINDINLSFDKDNRIRKTILRITGHDADKAYVLASFLYDAGFKQFLLENITKDDVLKGETISFDDMSINDFVKLKQNKFGSLLNLYYIEHYHSVDNSKTKKGLGRLNGFSSASAKTVAKNYNASLLIEEYRKEFGKHKDKRRKPLEIIAEVNKQMLNTFYDRTNDFARFIINDDSFSQEAKEYANKYLEVLREINEINENIANITSWGKATTQVRIEEKTRFNKLKKENASEELIKESTDKINKLGEEITANAAKRDEYVSRGATLTRDKYVIAQNLVALYSNDVNEDLGVRLRNYANLVAQTREDANAWYFQVFNTKTMTSIIKDFNNVGDIEEFMQEQEEDDDAILSQYDGQTIDETTKSWEDHNYKNFNQAIDSKLRIILSSIPKLAEKYNIADEVQALDTNNELGVRTFMDAQFITVQIFSFADFTSVESMINSLDIKSKSIKSLYGLGQIVNMMKRSKSFANYMYANFAKPVVNKTMLVISDIANENGISFDYSNVNAFPLTELIFRMANKLRATYNSAYDNKDIEALKNIQSEYNKNKNKSAIVEDIFDIVSKYFPNFNKQVFNNYFDNLPINEADESINQLIRNISQIIISAGNLKATINNVEEENRKDYESKKEAYYKAKKEYDKAINDYNKLSAIARANTKKPEPPIFPTYPRIDYANYELSKTAYKHIIAFAKQIVNYTESKARLNSTNAEGTTGSDVIKNCFVSRFFEQIMAESATDSNAGLENLKRYITQGTDNGQVNQYSNNPLFFGVKDENGNVIAPGMFTRTATGYEVNPNAKEILKLMLFDGSRNNQDGLGDNYASMSKVDFFITQYMAFTKSINEATDEGFTKKIGDLDSAVYPMRIGSDAPKIFFIRAPRYNDRQVRYALYNHVIDELNMMITGINNLFVQDGDAVIDGNVVPLFKTRKDITNLIGRAFFNENKANALKQQGKTDFTSAIVENGRLTGKLFNFYRLFDVNGYKASEAIESMLSLYGQGDKAGIMSIDKDGRMVLNQNNTIVWDGTKFVLNLSNGQKQELKNIVRTWADNFLIEAKSRTSGFTKILTDNNISYSQNELDSFLLNAANMNMNYDDLFEGDYKYYNKARDFLKRTKETQAGGDGYAGFNVLEDYDNSIKELKWRGRPEVISLNSTAEFNQDGSPVERPVIINNKPLIARNGWRGVTIYNTNKASDYADDLQKELERIFIKQGFSNEVAKDRSVAIARGYGLGSKQGTIINDAQSYITLEEFIRRRHADGTIQDYADIISQLLDDTPVENINIDELNNRIQVQKNFYFDKVFDKDTGLFYPRQIKNAEFVLIPKLLPEGSELRKVHDWMQKNDIGQLNTAETSKAAKKNIFTIWDVETGKFNENFEEDFNNSYIENYTYQYLYKQQEVPQHMMDENNKAGIQIMKKIIDNIINESEKDNPERKKLKQYADEYLDAYTANIKDDFNTFLDRMGWEYDTKLGKIVNSDYQTTDVNGDKLPDDIIKTNRETLNFNNFYARAREEAARLGMDSNFIEYLIPNEFGRPTMPNWQNAYSSKLESIAQAIYNRSITRQILPGWHAAQITDVGYSKRLKFDPETGVMQVYLPRWSNLIPKGKTAEEDAEILKQLSEEGLDIHLGYRIPTEGKQSIAVLKVVGFTNDCLGSTIVVPEEWVTQTGSDFDVDSVYGICWEMYDTKDKNGKTILKKVAYEETDVNDQDLYIRYVNNKLDARIKRTDIGEEIESSIKEIRDRINNVAERNSLNEEYNKLDDSRNELFASLPNWAKYIIDDANKKARTIAKRDKVVTDLRSVYSEINSIFTKYLAKYKISDDAKSVVEQYMDYQTGLIDVMNRQEGLPGFDKEMYRSEKAEAIQRIVEQAKQEYFNQVQQAAKKAGIMDYDTWSKQSFVDKLSKRARNNYILDRMIKIMNDETSREEQYGRSKFENIVDGKKGANDIIDKISGETSRSRSPYNPLDQLDYFEDAMGGARLKALSVMWDTFTSKNNKVRAFLDDTDAVEVILNTGVTEDSEIVYDIDKLNKSYGDDITAKINEEKVEHPKEKKFIIYRLFGENTEEGYIEGDPIYMSENRIKELLPIITEIDKDNDLITIPWTEFNKYNYVIDYHTTKEEIVDFLYEVFGYTYKDMPFKRGEFYITEPLYKLLTKTTAEEFYAIIRNYEAIINYDKKKETKTINNVVIDKFLNKYDNTSDESLLKVFTKEFNDINNVSKEYNVDIDKEVLNNERLKLYPESYNYLMQMYNIQNNIDIEEQISETQYIFKARRIGWSNDNRNVVGELVTTYTSQTTAHHLDAVKMGSVPNVDEYTFSTYKLLSTLGIDYETIISFIRQPAITNLVANNNLINSVFLSSKNNPIKMTINDIAANLGIKNGKYKINHTTALNDTIAALKANNNFKAAFADLFNIDISSMSNEQILNIKLPLDKQRLFTRIKRQAQNKGDVYQNAAFDLGVILTFRNIRNTAEKISRLITATNADKFGAINQIRENRVMIDLINELRKDKTLSKNGVSFIDLIYPTIDGNNSAIDINNSEYKSIAAIYSYATLRSFETNTQIFVTENEDFAISERLVQGFIRHKFTAKEYAEYKRYAISGLYNKVQKLLTPITIDKRGNIIPDNQRITEISNRENDVNKYWDAERSRIYGYGIASDGDFKVENLNNLTEEDIVKFNNLTPAQKVLFIQRHFPDHQGIFNYIKVTLINNTDVRYKGISRQYLSYDDQIDNIEDLLYMFVNSFSNKNKSIRLAAIDLVKYAYIAEGFNYKSGYISKIIPNNVLYTRSDEGGFDIINNSDPNNSLNSMIYDLPYDIRSKEFIENFIRSHSSIAPIFRLSALPDTVVDEYGNERYAYQNKSTTFKSLIRPDGLIYLDGTSTNKFVIDLMKYLQINTYNGGFIKVNFPISKNESRTVLFAVESRNEEYNEKGEFERYQDYFLVPLNLLDKYENYDYSYNENFNTYNDREYYTDVVDAIARTAKGIRETNRQLEENRQKLIDVTSTSNKNVSSKRNPVGAYKAESVSLQENKYGLTEYYNNSDKYISGPVKKLIDGIVSHIESDVNFTTPYIQYNPSVFLKNLIPAGEFVVQTIDVNGVDVDVIIAHLPNTNKFNKAIRENDEYRSIRESLKETNTSIERADVYRVIKHVPKKVYATTDLIVEPDETVVESSRPIARRGKSKPIDVLSSIITKTISYEARRNETAIAERFVKELEHSHVNKFSRSSLSNNRISVYRAAARYYRSASNAIINKLNKFVIDSNEYSMDDEAMYEALISHDEYFREVAQVILDGITFGNQIADIFKLDVTAEDPQTKEAVESIINSINAVRQNSKLNEALNSVINIYFKKYSTNPEIMRDILELRETFGDLDTIDAWISNPADIDNNEVQVIIKQIYNAFAKAELFDVRRNVKEWEDELAKIEAMNDSFDVNNVIDFEHFRIKPAYKNKFLEDRQRVIDELNEAMINRYNDLSSYDKYLRAKFARDKFMFDYTHQIMVDDYYRRDLAMRDEVMRKGGSLYTEFMMLRAQLYDDNLTIGETTEQTAERKARINNKIKQLLSKVDIVGNEKSFEEQAKIDAITNYLSKYRDLQDEYFEDKEYDGFQEDYMRYKEYLDNYNIEHPDYSFERKMQNVQYRDAYNWIKSNGRIKYSKEESEKLTKAFKALTGRSTVLSNGIYNRLKSVLGVIDEAGNIDATKLTKEQIKQIRDEAEFELSQMYDDGTGELILIKSIPSDIPIMMKKGNDKESKEIMEGIGYTNNKEKARIIGRINEIIGKTVDRKTGKIDIAVLFNDDIVSYDEREELADLYTELRSLRSEFTKNYLKKNNKVFEEHIDTSYLSAMLYYRTNLKNTKQGSQFLKIFTELDEDGNMVANSYIFGYRQPKPEYIDPDRTNARDYLNNNVEFITTEYYDIARREAESKGEEEFNEWFKLNHIYNPYSHKYEPLKIWTKLSAKPGSALAESVSYTPMFQNMERTVRDDKFINKSYKKFSNNYRTGTIYDTGIVLSDKEQALQNLLIQTLNKYATTYQGKRFVAEGYLPRERRNEINSRWAGSQLLSLMGLDWHSGTDSDSYQKEVDYTNDREADMDMLSFLKTKGTKKYLVYPNRNDFDTEEEYRNKLNQVKEENRKIKAENEKLDNAIVNKDWKAIMKNFVHNATIFNSRQAAKPYIHLLLEDLAANNAYAIDGMWNKHLIKDNTTSTEDDTRYKTIPQTKTRQVVSTLAHRLLFNEYHKNSTPRAIANFLQNMTSAKYMIFNAYGGVANVATGKVNIFMEEAANEYFGFKEFHDAELQYLSNSVQMIQHLYSDKSPNLTIALIKQFNIVNFDQVLQFGDGSANLDESLKRFRNWMYSFQSVGEHYMQNSVLLAMLKSNRLYTDRNGVQRIGDFKDYTWDVEQRAMEDILSNNNDLLIQYEIYKNKIKYDLEEKLAFDTGRKDYNRNFLYMLRDNENEAVRKLYKDTAEAYHKRRKELLDKAKEEFIKNDTVENLFEFVNGEAVLKQEKVAAFNAKGKNAIGDLEHLIGGFKKKVEEVNHKIHGVYDKISAAQLETKWYGSIVMQYHKHLYTGIFKRWRRKGFYSEFRGSRERGSYQTLIDFLGTEFTNFNQRVKNKSEEGEFAALASIQVAIESLINSLINIQFNWQNLSNWERANIRRNLGEMSGVLVAALVVMALYGLNDDDDIKDDPFKASLLYLADRLYSDTTMYSPLGLITEAKTAWSSPIASANGPSDLIKAIMLIPQALFDPDYNPEYQTGQYRGENKLEILLRRNIPGIRPYDRIRFITRNNKYYKIGESQIGINIAKNIGKSLRDN